MLIETKCVLCCRFIMLIAATALSVPAANAQDSSALKLDPTAMTKLGDVDPRYLSYNI